MKKREECMCFLSKSENKQLFNNLYKYVQIKLKLADIPCDSQSTKPLENVMPNI